MHYWLVSKIKLIARFRVMDVKERTLLRKCGPLFIIQF